MLFYGYVFSLIAGGILLGASIVLGGSGHDTDTHGGVAGHAGPEDHAPGAFGGALAMLVSLRFWTFFLAFFGLTGLVFTLFELAPALIGALAALGMGLFAGFGVSAIVKRLSGRETNSASSSADYLGKTALVLVPVAKGQLGKIRLTLKGSTIDVLAASDDEVEFAIKDEVLIVEMDGTTARIARLER
jgi:membrane protein implicated in regulation of membrane protease activity